MKRDRPQPEPQLARTMARKKRRRTKVTCCADDRQGPRIPTLFSKFSESSPISAHLDWLHHLELSCEKQGCFASGCVSRAKRRRKSEWFAWAHGAKTLVNGINLFLTYHIPRYHGVASDEEWRGALAALRSFHDFCVRRRYVGDDAGLKLGLHRLNKFPISSILARLGSLMDNKWWDSLHDASSSEQEGGLLVATETEEAPDRGYEAYVGVDVGLCVEQVLPEGWLVAEDSGEGARALLSLPSDVAALGVKGMTFSRLSLGLRNELWRPVQLDPDSDSSSIIVYPPDDVFID